MRSSSKDARPRAQTTTSSFDVFDTFLVRACTTPDGVYERAFQLALGAKYPANVAISYVQHRMQAEARARAAAKDSRNGSEVTIDEIYALFPFHLFGLDRTALQDLVDAEFQAELDLCRVNDGILRFYQAAQDSGQRVGFISDTYWSEQQLGTLLRHCKPDLRWDFLFASCEHNTSKSEKLFARYLRALRIDPSVASHIGDNPHADIKGARRYGIRTRYYPQATGALFAQFQRETTAFETLCLANYPRLDNGSRTLRRIITAQTSENSPAFQLGVTTLGPVMAAFDAFIARRAARLRRPQATVAVAFLGRDGFLSHELWPELHDEPGFYLEINRRVSLIASAATVAPIVDLFKKMPSNLVDAETFKNIIKILPESVSRFFKRFRNGVTTGAELAEALPKLLNAKQIAEIAAAMRASLLDYMRRRIPNFDTCTDIVLVDLGYSGSVQKALRRVFDCENINIRLHGTYLISLDDAYDNIDPDDTAEGFISDLVVSPHVKRMFTRNVAILEQICCSAMGSVREYRDGEVHRESDARTPGQLALVGEIQAGARAFVTAARDAMPHYNLAPFADLQTSANWTTALLGRLLLLPDDDELTLLGELQHDVNLGTEMLVPMLGARQINQTEIARGLPIACVTPDPPMWAAGSFASLSPALGYLYMLFGANRLPSDVFGEIKCGKLQIGLFQKNGSATMEPVAIYRNGMADIRIRIPVARSMNLDTIAIPLAKIAKEGILRGVTIQHGATARDAAENGDVETLPIDQVIMAGLERHGHYFRAVDAEGCLLFKPNTMPKPITILTIALSLLGDERMLAAESRNEFEDDLKAALFNPAAHGETPMTPPVI